MSYRIVLDTNVFISALLGPRGASREVLRCCLRRQYQPLMGTALFVEYESVMTREDLLDAFLSVCHWQTVYYAWRPNLPDETDNHVVELAVAGSAVAIVTKNTTGFRRAEVLLSLFFSISLYYSSISCTISA